MACTMPGFPDKYMPFMDAGPVGRASAANFQRFTYGPVFRYFRKRNIKTKLRQGARVAAQPGRS